MGEVKNDKWAGTTYGNGWMHKWLIRFLRVTDIRVLYGFANIFVIPPTMIVNSGARKSIYRFFRKRMGLGRWKSLLMTYRNHCQFSQVVIDRFAMYAGKSFTFKIDGYEKFQNLAKEKGGFVQLSSHIGNYELAGYSLSTEGKRLNALVFGGEKESVMANRNKLFAENNIRMIPVAQDLSHLFTIDKALTDGEIISMPADRILGSQKAFRFTFLGKEAGFPQGPFILAAMKNVPVLFVSVMKTASTEYHITVEQIEVPEEGNARAKARAIAERYVALLEKTVNEHPTQWYNYFDFWAE